MNAISTNNTRFLNVLSSDNKLNLRSKILDFESEMINVKGAKLGDNENCPLTHSFSDGMYVREIFIPKGMLIVGKIHKHDHPNFLLKGEVTVVTEEEGRRRIKAPCSMISASGTKRVVYTHEDTVWATVHSNPDNTMDLSKLEQRVIAKNYADYEQHINGAKVQNQLSASTNNNVKNCGIEALKNLNDLKNISIKTLIQLADDNGLKLYPYKVPVKELKSISLPAIVHSKDHFSYISNINQLDDNKLKYTGYVLLTQKADYDLIKPSVQNKIIGATWIAVAIIVPAIGTLGTAGIGYAKQQAAIKATESNPCELNCKDTCKAQHGTFFSGRQKCIKECNANCAAQANKPPPPVDNGINWWYVSAGIFFAAAILLWIFRKKIFKIA